MPLPLGKAQVLREGQGIAILAWGSMVETCRSVAEELGASLVNMRFVKPLDEDLVERMAEQHELLVTVEENAVQGGAGSAVNELLNRRQVNVSVLNIGIPDRYIEHGGRDDCLAAAGLDRGGILRQIQTRAAVPDPAARIASKAAGSA